MAYVKTFLHLENKMTLFDIFVNKTRSLEKKGTKPKPKTKKVEPKTKDQKPKVKVEQPKPKVQKPRTPRRTFIEFTGWADNKVSRGVLLDTREARNSTVNIVLVTHESGHRTTPYIKWINESYCRQVLPYSVSHIDSSNFNPKNWDLIDGKKVK